MSIDVIDLRDFYSQRLGIVARRADQSRHSRALAECGGTAGAGLGYPTPYLGLFREDCERCIAFMPAAQGVLKWPTAVRPWPRWWMSSRCRCRTPPWTASCWSMRWRCRTIRKACCAKYGAGAGAVRPPDGDHSQPARGVDPNRQYAVRVTAGRTPRSQITQLLRQTWFTPKGWGRGAVFCRRSAALVPRSAMAWERVGAALSLPFAGGPHRGSHHTGLSRHPGTSRTHPAYSGAAAGAGAVIVQARSLRESSRRTPGSVALASLNNECICPSGLTSRQGFWKGSGSRRFAVTTHDDDAYSLPGLKSSPGVAGAATPSGRGPCGRRRRRGGKRSPPLASKPAGPFTLRLRPGDEGGQAVDAVADRQRRLRLRLKLRLRTMLARVILARLMIVLAGLLILLFARLVGLRVARLFSRLVARRKRLLLDRDEARLGAEIRKASLSSSPSSEGISFSVRGCGWFWRNCS